MTNTERETLEEAFEYATDYVMENSQCEDPAQISNGWCQIWAQAFKRKAPFVEIREWQGHWFVLFDGVAYDSERPVGFAYSGSLTKGLKFVTCLAHQVNQGFAVSIDETDYLIFRRHHVPFIRACDDGKKYDCGAEIRNLPQLLQKDAFFNSC